MMSSSRSSHWLLAVMLGIAVAGLPFSQARAQDDAKPDYTVRLDAATAARLGIETAAVKAAQFRSEVRGFGAVIGFDGLAQTDADLTTAEAALRASQAAVKTSEAAVETSKMALERARGLFAANVSVSRQAVEAAERQVATDARQVDADMRQVAADTAQLSLAQRKAVAAWGQNLPWRNPAERTQLLARLTAGDEVLARVTFSNGVSDTPATLRIERVAASQGGAGWTTNRVWSAPADPTVPGRSFFVLINGARGLLPGERLIASLPVGNIRQGVIIPSASVLIAAGQAWYYQRETAKAASPPAPLYVFDRKMLDLSQPTADGYFVAGGDPKQLVVVDGAGLLLAREIGKEEAED